MTKPAELDKNAGKSNPAESLWDVDKPYVGPPEEGQPHLGSGNKETAPSSTVLLGDEPTTKK